MFDLINKLFPKKDPEFDHLKEFEFKDKYFYKTATWTIYDKGKICIIDPNSPRMITLDEWPQIIFLEAKGKLTVAEFVNYMASQYTSAIPKRLDETIIQELTALFNERLIAYSDSAVTLDPAFDEPVGSKK